MAAQQNNQPSAESRSKRAYTIMSDVRTVLCTRLADYVVSAEKRLRSEAHAEDSYSFSLQQMDEQILSKLNIVERAMGELARCEHRDGQVTTTTYEAIEVLAKRDELPQKIADALAEHGESDFLDMSVLRADDKQAEVLLILAREDSAPPTTAARPQRHQHGEPGEQGEDQSGNAGGNTEK